MPRNTGVKSPIKQKTGRAEDRSRSRSQSKPIKPKPTVRKAAEEPPAQDAAPRVASASKAARVVNYQELSFEDNVVKFMIQLKARDRGNVEGNAKILSDIISTFGGNAEISPEEIVGLVRRK